MLIDLKWQAQIKTKALIKALLFDKAPIKVSAEYSNYNNVFLAKNTIKLSK